MRAALLARLALAATAPLLLLLPAWTSLTAATPWSPSKEVSEMDAAAARGRADLVIVGPSFARTNLDTPALGSALSSAGGQPLRVARFAQNLASAPTWYAILRERVYGNGLKPRLVLLVATTDYLLEVHPPPERMSVLEMHFAEPDEVLRSRTWNSRLPAPLQRAYDRRETLRDPVVAAFRNPLVELFFDAADGGALATEAGVSIFGQEHGGGQARLLPVVEARQEAEAAEGAAASVAESYLPDIAALVAANGGRLVVVLPPVAASKAAQHAVSAEAERDIAETANALGVGLVDLRHLPYTELDYSDGFHMRLEARRSFTTEVSAVVQQIGALGTGPMQASWVPPAYTASREGTPPALSLGAISPGERPCDWSIAIAGFPELAEEQLRLVSGHLPSPFTVSDAAGPLPHLRKAPGECSGAWLLNRDTLRVTTRDTGAPKLSLTWDPALPARDEDGEAAWWVYPNGALSFAWPAGGPEGEWVAELEVVDPTGDATVNVSFGDSRAPLPVGGSLRKLSLGAAGAPGLSLRVESDAAVVVRSLRVRMGGRESIVVRPPTARLVDFLPGEIEAAPPPALPDVRMQVVRDRPALPAPFEDTLGCSPVRVTEDGRELPSGANATTTTNRPNGVVVDHVDGNLFVVSPDGSDPLTNGRRYQRVYTAERACRSKLKRAEVSRVWVYGEERIAATIAPAPPLASSGPIRALRVRAETNQPVGPEVQITFTLLVGGEIRLSATVPVADLSTGAELPLDAPITRRDDDEARLEVHVVGTSLPVLVSAVGMEG